MAEEGSSASPMRAIIIDDSSFMRKVLTDRLEENGIDVIGVAESGREGLKLFLELNPDIAFIDILMPDMDGLETLKEIKKRNLWAKAVIVTSLSPGEAKERAKSLGAAGYLKKPVDNDELKELLKRI